MIAPRRFLPSMSSLLALEAVDRLGSAVAAAEDLSLTHSAVSRQLKVLEEQLGVSLLTREGRGLALTPAGERYAASVRRYLTELADASLRLRASGSSDSINIAMPPSFGRLWMAPLIHGFMRHRPDIMVNQSTRWGKFEFSREKFDLAVYYGPQDWPAVEYLPLTRERVIAVAGPDLIRDRSLSPQDLRDMPLLHLEGRPGAWEEWFAHHGIHAGLLRGPLFDRFSLLADAAAAGLGIALLPEFMAKGEISAGRLVPVINEWQEMENRYYLVWPRHGENKAALMPFIDWMRDQIK